MQMLGSNNFEGVDVSFPANLGIHQKRGGKGESPSCVTKEVNDIPKERPINTLLKGRIQLFRATLVLILQISEVYCFQEILVRTRIPTAFSWVCLHQTPIPIQDEVIIVHSSKYINGVDTTANGISKKDNNDEEEPAVLSAFNDDCTSIWIALAERTSHCLYQSDIRRDAIGKQAGTQASSATNWIDDASAFALQKTMDKLQIKPPKSFPNGLDQDQAMAWMRWMQTIPAPAIIDLSKEFLQEINTALTNQALEQIDQSRDEFLSRIDCRLILLPSGTSLDGVLTEPSASVVYGKLLYGGVTRYRIIGHGESVRRAGARTEQKPTMHDNAPVWLMYGGADRMYQAVDMGAAAILEVVLLPRTKQLDRRRDTSVNMKIYGMPWKPKEIFEFQSIAPPPAGVVEHDSFSPASSMSGRMKNDAFRSEFTSAVGGLQPQIDTIVRRVLDGRVLRPADGEDKDSMVTTTTNEAKALELLGLSPVRGLLLYGPPGCGKTALARQISNALRARKPKIVAAPELLDRWVGGSEKLVRALFADAEAELASHNGDASKSALHVVVIDEIDAVFRKRTSAEDSGESTRSSVVNQILAKLDGMNAIPNLLLVGMTNRKELLDEALLRPGRLEVQIEVPMPNKEGRREILQIHFHQLRSNGRLSVPLCNAIDGPTKKKSVGDDSKRKRLFNRMKGLVTTDGTRSTMDLADATRGFSGADIAGLVRCAGSIALARCRQDGSSLQELMITLDDVAEALSEVKK